MPENRGLRPTATRAVSSKKDRPETGVIRLGEMGLSIELVSWPVDGLEREYVEKEGPWVVACLPERFNLDCAHRCKGDSRRTHE